MFARRATPVMSASRRTRRNLLGGLFATTAAVAMIPVVAASRSPRTEDFADGEGGSGGVFDSFAETYRGRRIEGTRDRTGGRLAAYDGGHADRWNVTVDGRPLHLMRRADGTWMSMVDHYQSYPTPLAAVRGAVDELGPSQQLRGTGHMAGEAGHGGVHA